MTSFSTLGASTKNNHIFFSPRGNSDARNSCGVQKASLGFSYHGGAAGVAEQGHRFGTGYGDSPTPQYASVMYDYPKRKINKPLTHKNLNLMEYFKRLK